MADIRDIAKDFDYTGVDFSIGFGLYLTVAGAVGLGLSALVLRTMAGSAEL